MSTTHGPRLSACFQYLTPMTRPDFNNTDPGRNQFSSLGNTPTGLALFDLNSPENEVHRALTVTTMKLNVMSSRSRTAPIL